MGSQPPVCKATLSGNGSQGVNPPIPPSLVGPGSPQCGGGHLLVPPHPMQLIFTVLGCAGRQPLPPYPPALNPPSLVPAPPLRGDVPAAGQGDTGGARLVPGPAGNHPDLPLRQRDGLQQGGHRAEGQCRQPHCIVGHLGWVVAVGSQVGNLHSRACGTVPVGVSWHACALPLHGQEPTSPGACVHVRVWAPAAECAGVGHVQRSEGMCGHDSVCKFLTACTGA